MSTVYCNNDKCKFFENQACTAAIVYYVDRLCMSFRKRPHTENYRNLMRTFETNCDKNSAGGGYKSSRITGVLK